MPSILLLGDIRSHRGKVGICDATKALCRSADVVIANLEGPVVERAPPRSGLAAPLRSTDSAIELLKDLNASVVTIANNHILDYGEDGLRETIAALGQAGIRCVGASTADGAVAHFLELPELDAVLLAFTHREGPVCEFLHPGSGPVALPGRELHAHIREWKSRGRRVLISYHGGEEYYNVPWPRRAAWARSIVDSGADVVFGHHSHSIQPIVRHAASVIIHGTGNFFFDSPCQRKRLGTDEGLMTLVEFRDDGLAVQAWKARSDWERQNVRVVARMAEHFFSGTAEDLDRQWIAEARRFVRAGSLKQKPLPGDGETAITFLNRARVVAYFILHNLRRGFSSVRERDILMSAMPFYGKYAIKAMKAGADDFRF